MGTLLFLRETVRWFPNRLWAWWLGLCAEFDSNDLERNPHRGDM